MEQGGKEFFRKRYEQLGGKIVDLSLPKTIRLNTLRASVKEIVARLEKIGIKLEKIPFTTHGFIAQSKFSLGAIAEYLLGYYYLQEAAAQLPVAVLNPKPDDVILDCCAAPGGKTAQLAQLMKNQGVVVAFEQKEHRIPSLLMNIERMGVENAVVFRGDAAYVKNLGIQFDKILLDAPCAGNFVTDPVWFEKRDITGIERSSAIQKRLLKSAVEVLAPNGTLVYSTCSLEPEENELNMQWAIDNLPVRLENVSLPIGDPALTNVFGKKLSSDIAKCRRFWPHKTNTEGFFIAKLVRI